MSGRSRSLRNGLDRDIYQIVRKLEEAEGSDRRRLTVTSVYDSIKSSNSSLARQKRKPLEDSIERVLACRKEEAGADEDAAASDELLERQAAAADAALAAAKAKRAERDAFLLNRQMTKHWDFSSAAAASSAASAVSSPGKPSPQTATTPGAGAVRTGPPAVNGDISDAATPAAVPMPTERQLNGEPKLKRSKRKRTGDEDLLSGLPVMLESSTGIKLEDLGGISHLLHPLLELVYVPLRHGPRFAAVGPTPKGGILLHGPSGTGKTALVHALAAKLKVAFIPVSSTSLVSGISGESEKNIRDFFDEAIRLAPSLVFIDEIDVVTGKKEGAQKAMEVRMLTEISQGLDKIARLTAASGKHVVVIAATNRADMIEPTVRRRFQELEVSMPDEAAREDILRRKLRHIRTSDDVDVAALARLTPGYVGADLDKAVELAVLRAVCNRVCPVVEQQDEASAAGLEASANPDFLRKNTPAWWWHMADVTSGAAGPTTTTTPVTPDPALAMLQSAEGAVAMGEPSGASGASRESEDDDILVTFEHLKVAVASVQPAAMREGFSTIPNTTWAEVGALQGVRRKLELAIVGPIEDPERFAQLGIKPAAGILLWGPPGCGKTLVAKAVANASKASFISIKGPELLNKYVGESEHNVRQLFSRAKASAPCILFFDEMDALAPRRDFGGNAATSRVVNALLTELDGVNDRSGIYVIGATNRADEIDEAIRRPGRLGTDIYVGLPSADDRVDILRTLYHITVPKRTVPDEAIARVARDGRCDGFTGADLKQLLQVASETCIMRSMGSKEQQQPRLEEEDFEEALRQVKPSVKDIEKYMA